MSLLVATAITENYVDVVQDYLQSLSVLTACRKCCITVGFNWCGKYIPGVEFIPLSLELVSDVDPDYICIQSGDFLNADLRLAEDDVVIFSDADGIFQRDFWPEERARFLGYDENVVGLGVNCDINDTLRDEYNRLQPITGLPTFEAKFFNGLDTKYIYNCGFIVARPAIWQKIRPVYSEVWLTYRHLWRMSTKTQFMLRCSMIRLGLRVDHLDYMIHSNGHFSGHTYRITPSHAMVDNKLYYKNQLVLFSHRITPEPPPADNRQVKRRRPTRRRR